MVLRLSPDWMTLLDERILEYLSEEVRAQPKMISDDEQIVYEGKYIDQRLSKLRDAGLVTRVGRGVYQLTDEGEAYLAGEFDARDIPDPDDEEVGT